MWSNAANKNTRKLQLIQNFACRIILGLKKSDHISQRLKSLGWLNVCDKLFLNDVVMVHKCINNLAPHYPHYPLYLIQDSAPAKDLLEKTPDPDLPKCRLATDQRFFCFPWLKGF